MTLRKGILLFIVISVAVSGIVLSFSMDEETIRLLSGAKTERLLVVLACVIGIWCCDATRFRLLALAAQERITFRLSLALTWLNYFGSAVTPMQGGGGPFQMYVLYRHGVTLGKTVAITLVRTLLTLFVLGLCMPAAFIVQPDIFQGQAFLQGMFSWVVVFVVGMWVVITLSLLRPRLFKRFASWLTIWLNRFGFVRKESVLRLVRRLNREIDDYNANFRLFFSTGLGYFLGAVVMTCVQLLCTFSVLPALIWALGLPSNFVECLVVQAMFMFLLYFVPTPGGSGVAEGGGAMLFKLLVPWNLAGVLAIAWRFFTEYLAILLGAFVAMRYLGWGTTDCILQHEKDENGKGTESCVP